MLSVGLDSGQVRSTAWHIWPLYQGRGFWWGKTQQRMTKTPTHALHTSRQPVSAARAAAETPRCRSQVWAWARLAAFLSAGWKVPAPPPASPALAEACPSAACRSASRRPSAHLVSMRAGSGSSLTSSSSSPLAQPELAVGSAVAPCMHACRSKTRRLCPACEQDQGDHRQH